jgi:hypothetical protein
MEAISQPPEHPVQAGGDSGDYAGELLASLRAELAAEEARRESFGTRGTAMAAAAGASAALLFGLGSRYSGEFKVPFFVLLLVGGLLFLVSAIFGWRTMQLQKYAVIDPRTFDDVLESGWDEDLPAFQLYMAEGTLNALRSAREQNEKRADNLDRALKWLLLGVAAVAAELVLVVAAHIS